MSKGRVSSWKLMLVVIDTGTEGLSYEVYQSCDCVSLDQEN